MPTYDLKCHTCGQEFEQFTTGILGETDKVCPKCDSHCVTQQFKSAPAVHKSDACGDTNNSGFG